MWNIISKYNLVDMKESKNAYRGDNRKIRALIQIREISKEYNLCINQIVENFYERCTSNQVRYMFMDFKQA